MTNPNVDGIWTYELCGCCGHFHLPTFSGDCRDDSNRFTADQLDTKHGDEHWDYYDLEDLPEMDWEKGLTL